MGSALFGSTAQFSNVLEFGDFTPNHRRNGSALIYVKLLAYNLTRVISIMGTQPLMAAITA